MEFWCVRTWWFGSLTWKNSAKTCRSPSIPFRAPAPTTQPLTCLQGNCSLFWHGFGYGLHGPRAVLGPLAAGGFEVMEVSEGHHFSFAFVGTLQLLLLNRNVSASARCVQADDYRCFQVMIVCFSLWNRSTYLRGGVHAFSIWHDPTARMIAVGNTRPSGLKTWIW